MHWMIFYIDSPIHWTKSCHFMVKKSIWSFFFSTSPFASVVASMKSQWQRHNCSQKLIRKNSDLTRSQRALQKLELTITELRHCLPTAFKKNSQGLLELWENAWIHTQVFLDHLGVILTGSEDFAHVPGFFSQLAVPVRHTQHTQEGMYWADQLLRRNSKLIVHWSHWTHATKHYV